MTFQAKLALIGIVGIVIILLVSIAGCGDVTLDMAHVDGGMAGAAGAGVAGAAGAEKRGDGSAGEMTKLDGGAAGAGGIGGAAGASAGSTGAAGDPGRPLGAGCTDDTQCGSSICAKAVETDTAGTCCNGRPDTCSVCVGGYRTLVQDGTTVDACRVCRGGQITPLVDGTPAGTCNTCVGGKETPLADGTTCAEPDCTGASSPLPGGQFPYYRSARYHVCMTGACTDVVRDCTTMLTCAGGTTQNCGGNGFCNSDSGLHGDCSCYTGSNTATVCDYPSP